MPSLPAFRDVSADDSILIARELELLKHTRAGIKYPSVISFSLLKAEVSKRKKWCEILRNTHQGECVKCISPHVSSKDIQ